MTAMVDLSVTGTLHAFLLLAARRAGADTLFFQRRLRMEGDTVPGPEVKHFPDGLDVDSLCLPRQASRLAHSGPCHSMNAHTVCTTATRSIPP